MPRERLRSPRLIEIAAYLDSKRRDGHPPRRADLDPITEIPRLTQHLQLVERDAAGRYRCRLMGSIPVDIHGRDMTGLYLDAITMDQDPASWDPTLAQMFTSDELLCGVDRPPWELRAHLAFEWISQRLVAEPGAPEILLLALDYQSVGRAPPSL